MTAKQAMVKIFLFLFSLAIAQIVKATNSKGCEIVIRVTEGGNILRPPTGPDDHPEAERRPRSNSTMGPKKGKPDGLAHNPLTAFELVVFLGQRI